MQGMRFKGLDFDTSIMYSPEVWRDEAYSFVSDIWSTGCVIYEVLTLKPPF